MVFEVLARLGDLRLQISNVLFQRSLHFGIGDA